MLMLRFTYAFTRSEEIFDISNGGKHGEIIAFILIGPWLSLFFHEMWFNNCITIVTIVSYAD